MPKSKLARWLVAMGVLLTGILFAGVAARWLKSIFGLPSFVLEGRGAPSDLIEVALVLPLLFAYLRVATRLLRIDMNELGRMLRGH